MKDDGTWMEISRRYSKESFDHMSVSDWLYKCTCRENTPSTLIPHLDEYHSYLQLGRYGIAITSMPRNLVSISVIFTRGYLSQEDGRGKAVRGNHGLTRLYTWNR